MNDRKREVKTVTLAYFSGTGGTKAIVSCFETQFIKSGIHVNVIDISSCNTYHEEKAPDLLIIFSPVYAFRLASIVEHWIKNLPKAQNMPAAVISVSGGGEISPNTACRDHGKRLLAKKGYHIIYEKMFVMPSNYASQADYQLNLQLLNVIPLKVTQAITEILSGKIHLTKPRVLDYFFAFTGKAEHFGAKIFGLSIHDSKECTQCGLCARKCPANNIKIHDGVPKFGSNCMWCLKCIYDCPHQALSPGVFKFSILKDGYNLREMSEKAKTQLDPKYQPSGSMLWQGVIDYLKN
jgi:ferredoxin/flavodoxin